LRKTAEPQIPNLKHKIPSKSQERNPNDQNMLEDCDLEIVICLEFVIWKLIVSTLPGQ